MINSKILMERKLLCEAVMGSIFLLNQSTSLELKDASYATLVRLLRGRPHS